MSFNDSKTKSTTEINEHEAIEIPPPPYENNGVASISNTHSHFYQENNNVIPNDIRPFIQTPVPLQTHSQTQPEIIIISETPSHGNFARGRPPNEPGSTFSTNHKIKKPQNCITRYWSIVIDPNAWSSCLYLLLISPVISSFAFFWVFFTFVGVVISLILPPVGFFLGIVTLWSWRALGRLEILTVQLCTIATHKPSYSTQSRFHPIIHLPSSGGLLTYGGTLFSDGHTWMCFVYFVFVKSVWMLAAFLVVFSLFLLAFSPLMLFLMPTMCLVCKKFGKVQVEIAEKFLLRRK